MVHDTLPPYSFTPPHDTDVSSLFVLIVFVISPPSVSLLVPQWSPGWFMFVQILSWSKQKSKDTKQLLLSPLCVLIVFSCLHVVPISCQLWSKSEEAICREVLRTDSPMKMLTFHRLILQRRILSGGRPLQPVASLKYTKDNRLPYPIPPPPVLVLTPASGDLRIHPKVTAVLSDLLQVLLPPDSNTNINNSVDNDRIMPLTC